MRQLLHLQHHRHTGKLLHHEHTSYHALVLIFVVSGFFMFGLNMASRAAADEFGVSAMVNVPVPTSPPIISSPGVGAVVSTSSVLVTGTCPLITPQVVVSVRVNGQSAGTAACDDNNDFSVPVAVSNGDNQITAGALTISGQEGPVSSPVSISSRATSAPSTVSLSATRPFIYVSGKDVTWTGDITASNPGSEHVHIDWGDGSQSNYAVSPGAQSFTHDYASLVSHNVVLDVANTSNDSFSEQFAAASFTSYAVPVPTSTRQPPFFETTTVIGLYGIYLTVLSVMGIIWLEAKHAARHQQSIM